MKKLSILVFILPLISLSLNAQKAMMNEDGTVYYKITEAYYENADTTYNLTGYFRKGFLSVMESDTGKFLTIEEKLKRYLAGGTIKQIEKPESLENDSATYYRYDFDGFVFEDNGDALVLKEKLDGSYEKYGVCLHFWAFVFRDKTQLQIYGFKMPMDDVFNYMMADTSFIK
mgnify:CR=1 FL=1